MKKYKVIIINSLSLLISMFLIALINCKAISYIAAIAIAFLCLCTFALIALAKFNYKGYTDIPTWKHIRNLVIYVASVLLGSFIGCLL